MAKGTVISAVLSQQWGIHVCRSLHVTVAVHARSL
jgi:hypothetical protein